jgi:hypothetical protein
MVELGRQYLLPLSPPESNTVAMLAAIPKQIVDISQFTRFIVSYIARPELITPPGLLIYTLIPLSGSSLSKYSSWAIITFAIGSDIGVPRKIILSLSKRE